MTRNATVMSWLCQVTAAVILGQTLFFKFTGAEESVYIFRALGMEPWGRIGSGVMELAAAILLLTPRLAGVGGVLSMMLMSGAILAHSLRLGLVVKDDGGLLFALAVVTLACSATVALLRRRELPVVGELLERLG